ncbi:acetyltransferase [Mycena belliarum]|uniref:Acetyltransferase n=1 Tax=Mycena belliarum TaxID=1033014 RepID=A0AAD6TUP6_9AGAR|nr:acetyltransferase [Mycena belliae]
MHARTARLTLRELTLEDIPAIYALESLPEVARYQTWLPRTRADAEDFVHKSIKEAAAVPRVIVEQAVSIVVAQTRTTEVGSGPEIEQFIGRVGGHIDATAHTAEMWFSFFPTAQGQGYATEALRALLGQFQDAMWNGDVPPFDRFIIECDPRNDRSSKLAGRVGFSLQSCTEKAFECKGEWVGSAVYWRGLDVVR